MNADGSGQTNLTNHAERDSDPVWSPDGTKIAFTSFRDGSNGEIYVMNADGSGQTNLSNNAFSDGASAWSPDGAQIAFHSLRDGEFEVYVMNADGSSQTNISNNGALDVDPAWSPDGAKIAFASNRDFDFEVYVMNADGSGQTNLTNNAADDFDPDWQPLPNQAPDCTPAVPSQTSLWPPNHGFSAISVLGVSDPNGDPFTIVIDSIFQDEAVDAPDSGHTAPDGHIVGATAEVRRERVESGNGRVYHITFTASDDQDASCTGTVQIGIPVGKQDTAVDDGPLFDSTVVP
jgi:WD40 repeat protein